jgi:nicotinate-nucleotide pyrophosphorylase (carboxylating)
MNSFEEYLKKHNKDISNFLQNCLSEDVGESDHTSLACVPESKIKKARIVAKEKGIVSGVFLAETIFHLVDKNIKVEVLKTDGDSIDIGENVLLIEGSERSILTAERLVLNFMQRMSGIATLTSYFNQQLEGTNTKVLDTRKTTPSLRIFEKWAVLCGGGENHRMGLYDMIMIKDNHSDYAGGVDKAIEKVEKYLKDNHLQIPIIVEARDLDEVKEILKFHSVKRVLLDNFTPEKIREALVVIDGKIETEASGGINKSNIKLYANTGVNYISIGALTHGYKSLDLSLKAV